MWDVIFHRRNDELRYDNVREFTKKWFFDAAWFDVYNLIEWTLPRFNRIRNDHDKRESADDRLNYYLEREMSGYRAVNGNQLVQITSAEEIAAIEEASRAKTGYEGVAEHVRTALELLGKKPEPDYRNSIKESISAVETAAILVTGDKKATLDKALAKLESKGKLHGAFKNGVSALFGWTSDADGIRHSILNEQNVGFPAASIRDCHEAAFRAHCGQDTIPFAGYSPTVLRLRPIHVPKAGRLPALTSRGVSIVVTRSNHKRLQKAC